MTIPFDELLLEQLFDPVNPRTDIRSRKPGHVRNLSGGLAFEIEQNYLAIDRP